MTGGADAAARAVESALDSADAGVVAAAVELAAATPADGHLRVDGDPLTADRLATVADGGVRRAGGDPSGATTVEPAGELAAGRPVRVALEPRVDGVAGPLSRTFVVDGRGGWERRAAVAVGMAHDAVRRVVEPGLPARRVVDEAIAELGAYGLAADGPVARSVGSRVLDFSTDDSLDAGDVFVLDPIATETDRGRVRIGTCYTVTESGCRPLGSTPTSLSTGAYDSSE
ncbi:M24 family metallopeptidase [Haloplanus salilacus]|uniref:M24 family metallopeptidase n=1 Tax=Haloplanus salilacus TaxID=2949994 RepID=UPI0030D16F6A